MLLDFQGVEKAGEEGSTLPLSFFPGTLRNTAPRSAPDGLHSDRTEPPVAKTSLTGLQAACSGTLPFVRIAKTLVLSCEGTDESIDCCYPSLNPPLQCLASTSLKP